MEELVERLLQMAPKDGWTILCDNRTTREMNRDIRAAAARITSDTARIKRRDEALRRIAEMTGII